MGSTAAVTGATDDFATHDGERVQGSPFNVPWQKLMMWIFLCSDGMGFIGLLAAYAMLRAAAPAWPIVDWFDPDGHVYHSLHDWLAANPGGTITPYEVFGNSGIFLTALNTFILICSSVTMVKAYSACLDGDQAGLKKYLAMTIGGGVIFLGFQAYEWTHLITGGMNVSGNPLGATFYALTGFHGAHVFSGVVYLTFMWIGAARGKYGPNNSTPIEVVGLFWHFVDLVWIVVFTVIYLI